MSEGTSFWVIEKVKATGSVLIEPKYWAAGQQDPLRSSAWTGNIHAAIRFFRKDDAQNVISRMMYYMSVRATEHII